MFDPGITTADYMSIIVTHECNRNCPFCVDSHRGKAEFISMESVNKAVHFGISHSIKDILLVGGEPTLHPEIVKISQTFCSHGFNVILTSNFDDLNKIYELDPFVSSFNMSNYGQELPDLSKIKHADLTLSSLIYRHRLGTKKELDEFIDRFEGSPIHLKFSTLTPCNEFAKREQKVDYLDKLPGKRMTLFNEILGQEYRGCLIKRYDRLLNPAAVQSFKCHPNGTIDQQW